MACVTAVIAAGSYTSNFCRPYKSRSYQQRVEFTAGDTQTPGNFNGLDKEGSGCEDLIVGVCTVEAQGVGGARTYTLWL